MSRPDPYVNGASHPPGQGHYPSYQDRGYSDDGHRRSPPQHSRDQQQPYFDPPPREPFPESGHDRHYSYDEPHSGQQYPDRGSYDYPQHNGAGYDHPQHNGGGSDRDRPYAPADPGPHDYNQMTPYDDEKAEAEWRRGVEEAYTYQRPPPPPQDREYERRRALEEEARLRDIERDREIERQRRYEEDRLYEEEERRRERDRRRRRDEDAMREKALRYPSDPKKGGRDVFGGSEGERGFGAKLAGGAGGALIGHELSDNILGTVGGAVVGAVAANFVEKHHEKKSAREKMVKRRSRDDSVRYESVEYPPPGRRMDDVRRTGRDGGRPEVRDRDRYERGRDRSVSAGTGLKDRIMRSLSRARSKSAPRRRSASYDSEYSHRR